MQATSVSRVPVSGIPISMAYTLHGCLITTVAKPKSYHVSAVCPKDGRSYGYLGMYITFESIGNTRQESIHELGEEDATWFT